MLIFFIQIIGKDKAWKTIDEALVDMPKQGSAAMYQGEGIRKKPVLKKAEVERERKEFISSKKSASQPTYAVESITSLAKKEREQLAKKHERGKGYFRIAETEISSSRSGQ